MTKDWDEYADYLDDITDDDIDVAIQAYDESTFYKDLAEDLKDPVFRAEYLKKYGSLRAKQIADYANEMEGL